MLRPPAALPSMFGHRYDVALTFTDCAPAESLSQALDNLQHLDAVITDLFSRITHRVTTQRQSIAAINTRITAASNKVNTLAANPSRVTTLLSAAKYPAPRQLADYKRVNELSQVSSVVGSHVDERTRRDDWTDDERYFQQQQPRHLIKRHSRFIPTPPTDTSALFTALSKARLTRTEHVTDEAAEGLGRLPAYLPSISSVLLFNSDENPYKQYSSVNNLEGVGGQDRQQAAVGPSAAPKSIVEGADLPTFSAYQFEYKPVIGDLPTFNLPANLPLGMIADIQFGSADNLSSIAPSSAANTLTLPNLSQLALPTLSLPTVSTLPPVSAASAPAPPPPPPPPAAPSPSAFTAPNAPPPPPPPSAPDAPPPPPRSSPSGGASSPSAAPDARGSLLDAIRNAKNAKLRKVVRDEEKDGGGSAAGEGGGGGGGGKKKAEAGGGDMMEALKARLQRRNQALSGQAAAGGGVGGGGGGDRAEKPKLPTKLLPKLEKKEVDADVEDDGESGTGAAGKTGMADVVMKAYMQAHKKKNDEEDEDWQ